MSWPLKKVSFNLFLASALLSLIGCGVKGDPLPPERPAELGRGRPTYRKATEGIRVEKARNLQEDDESDSDHDEENDDE